MSRTRGFTPFGGKKAHKAKPIQCNAVLPVEKDTFTMTDNTALESLQKVMLKDLWRTTVRPVEAPRDRLPSKWKGFFGCLKGRSATKRGNSKSKSLWAYFSDPFPLFTVLFKKTPEVAKSALKRALVPGCLASSMVVEIDATSLHGRIGYDDGSPFGSGRSSSRSSSPRSKSPSPTGSKSPSPTGSKAPSLFGSKRTSTIYSFSTAKPLQISLSTIIENDSSSLSGSSSTSSNSQARGRKLQKPRPNRPVVDPEVDWNRFIAHRQKIMSAQRDRVRSDVPVDTDERKGGPLRLFIPSRISNPITAVTSFVKDRLPLERGIIAVEEYLEGSPGEVLSPLGAGRVEEDEESETEGYLDENCEPFVFE